MSGTNYRAFGLFALSLVFLASNLLMLLGVDTGVPSLLLQWLVLNMAKPDHRPWAVCMDGLVDNLLCNYV